MIKVRLTAAAMAGLVAFCLAGTAQAAEPTLARNLAANCTSCHGFNGASAGGMPSLEGQPLPVLLTAMRAFRDGTRPATVMHQLARGYTDQQLEALAAFFASQPR
ncbi:MAG TPA: c-type cytochrome [Ramlibacter sp.]|nr:c-type cytochrome [Ramlibacter sp.]